MKLKISDILKATGGTLLCGDENIRVLSFFSDSRDTKRGGMFLPIRGERVDSHQFIDAVFAKGAAAAFTEMPLPARAEPLILVPSSIEALQKTVAFYRDQFHIPVVGITGSIGKTSAKEMIALALSAQLKTLKTAGNQNSQIGVPLTVCRLKKDHQAAVIEMGISLPGEMARIANVVKPTHAVITNIGSAHIEYLKTRENILYEKLHIADHLTKSGTLFISGDDDLLASLKHRHTPYKVVSFGTARDCDFRASSIRQVEQGMFFTCECYGESQQVFLPAVGVHNVRNALASMAVARTLGVDSESAVRALASYRPPAMRQQIMQLQDNITIIDDSYNASPDSMRGAIDILTTLKPGSRTVAVLGDMLELGEHSEASHFELGKYAAEKQIDCLIGVGSYAQYLGEGFGKNHPLDFRQADDAKKALDLLTAKLQPGDVVLIKGSRGIHLDEMLQHLTSRHGFSPLPKSGS